MIRSHEVCECGQTCHPRGRGKCPDCNYFDQRINAFSKQTGTTERVTRIEWESVLRTYGNRCARCGATQKRRALSMDHIRPVSKGGLTTLDNLQPLCHRCNSRKNAKEERYLPVTEDKA